MQTRALPESDIPARWLTAVRVAWLLCAVLLLIIFLVGLPLRYDELRQVCSGPDCVVLVLAPQEVEILRPLGLSPSFYASFQIGLEFYLVLTYAGLAGLIFWRKSDTWIGVLASLIFLFVGLVFFAEEPRALMRAYPALKQPLDFVTSIAVVLFMLFFYFFPDGRFVPRSLRHVIAAVVVVILLTPLLFADSPRAASASLVVVVAGMGGALLGFLSQFYRYRRVSTPEQRQQTKWVIFGFISMFSTALIWTALVEISSLPPGPTRLVFNFSLLPQYLIGSLFPISVVISMLRYRLWDIDLIIRRTLIYGLLTGALVLVYSGSVVALQQLLPAESQLAIVVSTLAIAALFNPLRQRIQRIIDRRFYRRKYNAQQILAQFAQTARDEVDMPTLQAEMLRVAQETMQPEHLFIWIKPVGEEGGQT